MGGFHHGDRSGKPRPLVAGMVGSLACSSFELGLFHPIDTMCKRIMCYK